MMTTSSWLSECVELLPMSGVTRAVTRRQGAVAGKSAERGDAGTAGHLGAHPFGCSAASHAEEMLIRLVALLAARCAYDFGDAADLRWRGNGVLKLGGLTKIVRLFLGSGLACLFIG